MKRLWVSPVWLLLACGVPPVDVPHRQIAEEEVRVSVAALEHAVARLRDSGEISATSSLVLAPERLRIPQTPHCATCSWSMQWPDRSAWS